MYFILYKPSCSYSQKVLKWFEKNKSKEENASTFIDVSDKTQAELRRIPQLRNLEGRITVPQVFKENQYIGDSEAFFDYIR